ncbi:MAG: hypothetical protein LC104_01345 [Bacteroidales bacterium]|nr:hypothetical protein [Bacteroidales bacterium]
MTCETIQNRLLAHTDLDRVPAEIRTHLGTCPQCQAFAQAAMRLDQLLPRLPVPPASETAKQKLLAQITSTASPILPVLSANSTAIPITPAAPRRRLPSLGWPVTAGFAATVALAAVLWWSGGDTPHPEQAQMRYQRHPLLQKEVAHVAALANARTSPERLTIWADVVADLRTEAAEVYLIAPESEIRVLGKMFDRAVHDGIIRQAERFPEHVPPVERQAILTQVMKKLQAAEADVNALAEQAPPQSQSVLRQMAATAREGLAHVEALRP